MKKIIQHLIFSLLITITAFSQSVDDVMLISIMKNRMDFFLRALENGANVDANMPNSYSAIHVAAQYGRLQMVRILLEKGANANNVFSGQSVLHFTALYNNNNKEVKRIARKLGLIAQPENNVEIARLLIAAGADVNVNDNDGYSPLAYSVGWNDVRMAALLIKSGADVHQTYGGRTLLQAAIKMRYHQIANLLRNAGAR